MAFGVKVAVVGGSIAGCAAAIALQRIGCEVTAYERSTGQLVDRGAGLGIPLSLLQTLVARDLVDADMVYFEATKCPFVLRSDNGERDAFQGRILWEQPIAVAVTNWSVLYQQLRSRVPDNHYHQGHEVIDIHETGDEAVSVHLSDGRIVEFDLVVCADGQHSVGRRLLFPDQSLQYVGYIFWRGLAEVASISHLERFEDRITWAVGPKGYCLLYLVPSRTDILAPETRQVNWVLYENVTDRELPGVLTDAQGVVHPTSLPPGAASTNQVTYVQDHAQRYYPGYIAEAVAATSSPFIQAVFDLQIPHYRQGRICVLGDASALCRPHAASGAVKALTNAMALADAFTAHDSLDRALHAWDLEQSAEGRRLVTLGQVMGRAFVQTPPAWQHMDEAAAEQWWTDLMSEQHYWYVTEDARPQS